jgi:murein DD-endopeptidase MepM/ murein hydrolase activator NlpD
MEGNYLVLDLGDRRYVMFAHLKQGGARVAASDRVQRGQPIAQVGNSGSTSEPHLHLQIQNQPTFGPTTLDLRTYPMLLRDVVLIRGGQQSEPPEADPRRDDRIHRASG